MEADGKNNDDMKRIYKQMVAKCEEYLALKDSPGRESDACRVKREVMRLYSEIATRNGEPLHWI